MRCGGDSHGFFVRFDEVVGLPRVWIDGPMEAKVEYSLIIVTLPT
jgi:hypothetical protein